MPDEIKKDSGKKSTIHDRMQDATRLFMRKIQPQIRQLSYDEIVNCYWSAGDRQTIDSVMTTLVSNARSSSESFTITRKVKLENEALPLPLEVTLEVLVREPDDRSAVMWPKAMMQQDANIRIPIPEVDGMAQEIAETAFNKGLFLDIVTWLLANCKTHQQAAWLFPMWVPLLQQVGGWQIANNCGDTAAPRVMPALPPFMRQKLRYMNGYLSGHMLMETFSKPMPTTDDSLCTMRLLTDQTYSHDIGDVVNWVSLKM